MAATADNDPMTGLPTFRQLKLDFEQLSRDRESFGLLLLDVDGLILFNDAYGHAEGDALLERIANFLCQAISNDTRIFRSAGEEFTIIWEGETKAEIISLAIQLRESLNRQLAALPPVNRLCYFHDGSQLLFQVPITVSGCILFYPTHGRTFAELQSEALDAMSKGGKLSHPGGVLVLGRYRDIALVTGPAN